MNVALLNVRITVQKNEVVVDGIGNRKSCEGVISHEYDSEN